MANIQSPEENVVYMMENFNELLPQSCEELSGNALKTFEDKMNKFSNKKSPDAHGFLEYVCGSDLTKYMQSLKAAATKKKPLSFQRLNTIIMAIFKGFE